MECQIGKKVHFWHLLLFAFNQGAKVTEAARGICAVSSKNAITRRIAHNSFKGFIDDNFDLEDILSTGRTVPFDDGRLT